MDAKLRAVIDAMKLDMTKQAAGARQANEMVSVSGKRYKLLLEDRVLGMVYYSCGKKNAPLIMGFHGGGFLFGGSAFDDAMWKTVSEQLGADVASIDYRMAPEYMCPAPIEDTYDAAVYLKEHAEVYGFDPSHISVMGCSAGGNIASAVCIYAKDKGDIKFDYQILIYPNVDCATDPEEKGRGSLPNAMLYVFNELYVKPENAKDPYCSPLFAADERLADLPAAIICMAENDCMNKEGREYARRLEKCGNKVFITETEPGIPHGYFEYGFGTGMGQDFLDDSVKAQIVDGSIARNAQKSLGFIKEHFYK